MYNALKTAEILLPVPGTDLSKWAVVACDQYTAQPKYWADAEAYVGGAPSTLRITLPEIWLGESETRIPAIHESMRRYLDEGVLTTCVQDGFMLVERTTASGVRPGLVVALDLEEYDFNKGSRSLIRPTEGTVIERVPPRARIRRGAPVELPHVMMLIDDPEDTVIGPLMARRESLRKTYDFELMLGGGHLRGWAVEGDDVGCVYKAIDALNEKADGFLYAAGDGNHSLAAAKSCWLDIRKDLTPEQMENHPARYALVELVNLSCPALIFEAIHRVLFNVDPEDLVKGYKAWLEENAVPVEDGRDVILFTQGKEWGFKSVQYPLRLLQAFLDDYLAGHPDIEVDYIHGEEALRELVDRPDAMGIMPRAFDKTEFFDYIRKWGVLPRKAFSMGEAPEKRYYLEARRIL